MAPSICIGGTCDICEQLSSVNNQVTGKRASAPSGLPVLYHYAEQGCYPKDMWRVSGAGVDPLTFTDDNWQSRSAPDVKDGVRARQPSPKTCATSA